MIAGAPAVLQGLTRRAEAQKKGVIRMLFTAPTMIPGDWSRFEADTGLKMEDTVIKDDPGIFLTEVEVNDAGDRFDLISTLSGVEQSLIDGGYITQAETGAMPNWGGMPDSIKGIPYLVRDLSPDGGKVWGVPLAMNADSFGYLPAKLNEPRPPEEASWSLVFDSEKTMGRSSTGDNYIYLWEALAYLKNVGNLEEVYTALEWFLSGGYASTITPLRGYLNGRPDLATEYAERNGMADISTDMDAAQEKLKLKFAKEDFWFSAVPAHLQEMQAQMDRVLNA